MPLEFESLSHGTIAFGFFNIESDMLLCDRYFFFADDFCEKVMDMAGHAGEKAYQTVWAVQAIAAAEEIGDLMGAIHGERFTGFLGDAYRRLPFPARMEDFKQKPEGQQTQALFRALIEPYARPCEIRLAWHPEPPGVSIGDLVFTREVFHDLLRYVWRGGWPRWRNEERPDYVEALAAPIDAAHHPTLSGLHLRP